MPCDPFTHLHVASGYSMRHGASHPQMLVETVAEYGMDTLALTDRDGLYGVVKFAKACRAAGIRPVFGVDLAVEPSGLRRLSAAKGRGSAAGPSRIRTPARGGLAEREHGSRAAGAARTMDETSGRGSPGLHTQPLRAATRREALPVRRRSVARAARDEAGGDGRTRFPRPWWRSARPVRLRRSHRPVRHSHACLPPALEPPGAALGFETDPAPNSVSSVVKLSLPTSSPRRTSPRASRRAR